MAGDMSAGQVTLEVRAVSTKLAADMAAAKAKITPALNNIERSAKIDMSTLATSLGAVSGVMPGLAGGAAAAAGAMDALKVAVVGLETAAAPLMIIAAAVAAIGAAFSGSKASMESAAMRETLVTTYEAILKDRDAAVKLIASMQELANRTPLETEDIAKSGRLLLAMGFTAAEVVPLIREIGDAAVASGKGAEGMQRIALILGQIKNKGRLQGDELLQLSEAGLNPLGKIGEAVGKTGVELQKMISDGKVSADTAIRAIRDSMISNFGGAMDKVADTFDGKTSNMKDAWTSLKITLGTPIINALKPYVEDVATFLNYLTREITKFQEMYEVFRKFVGMRGEAYIPKLPTPEEPPQFQQFRDQMKAEEDERKRAAEALPLNLQALKEGEELLSRMVKERTDSEKAKAKEVYDAIKQRAKDGAEAAVSSLRTQYEAHQSYAQKTMAIYTNMANASAATRGRMVSTNVGNVGQKSSPDWAKHQENIAQAGQMLLSAQYLGIPQGTQMSQPTQGRWGGASQPQQGVNQIVDELKGVKLYLYQLLQQEKNTRQQAVLS